NFSCVCLRCCVSLSKECIIHTLAAQKQFKTGNRVFCPPPFEFFLLAVSSGIIAGGVCTDAVRERFDSARPPSCSSLVHEPLPNGKCREWIISINLDRINTETERTTVQRGARLPCDGHRNRPMVVLHHKNDGS